MVNDVCLGSHTTQVLPPSRSKARLTTQIWQCVSGEEVRLRGCNVVFTVHFVCEHSSRFNHPVKILFHAQYLFEKAAVYCKVEHCSNVMVSKCAGAVSDSVYIARKAIIAVQVFPNWRHPPLITGKEICSACGNCREQMLPPHPHPSLTCWCCFVTNQ